MLSHSVNIHYFAQHYWNLIQQNVINVSEGRNEHLQALLNVISGCVWWKMRLRLRHVSARPTVLIHRPIVGLCMIVYVYKSEVMACIGSRGALLCAWWLAALFNQRNLLWMFFECELTYTELLTEREQIIMLTSFFFYSSPFQCSHAFIFNVIIKSVSLINIFWLLRI